MANRKKKKRLGVSMIEIMVTLTIFSTAIAGLYLAAEGMNKAILTAMKRDIESAYVNMKISEINPNNPAIESAYDVTSKTQITLPEGDSFWYTRIVDSAAATPDIKNVNIYLYHSSTETTPYRRFKRELVPSFTGFWLGSSTNYYKDSQGRVWVPPGTYASTSGSRQSGLATGSGTVTDISGSCGTVTGTADQTLFKSVLVESNAGFSYIEYKFFATVGREYTLILGGIDSGTAVDPAIYINGNLEKNVDYSTLSGGTCKAIVQYFPVQPVDIGGGVGVVTVRLSNNGTTAAFLGLQRDEL